ncbi:hypothetical protein EYF80_052153 [Liparis tanakae]|uniref:Uncharacterized protein n=1 Tax=Liparis tanakae TaxID=230148 RepID=A0A4Z2FA79_9TELE|nr:hypothetical protein EYF80_052153 [Liparis tanakae]
MPNLVICEGVTEYPKVNLDRMLRVTARTKAEAEEAAPRKSRGPRKSAAVSFDCLFYTSCD